MGNTCKMTYARLVVGFKFYTLSTKKGFELYFYGYFCCSKRKDLSNSPFFEILFVHIY